MLKDIKNWDLLSVVQTSKAWYQEGNGRCCGFDGYLESCPDTKVNVIIGWKNPDIWEPIHEKFKDSKPGSIFVISNDANRFFGYVDEPSTQTSWITLTTNTAILKKTTE